MKITEFEYDLHDSIIKNIVFDYASASVRLYISLCNWRQKTYTEDMPEIIDTVFVFEGVSEFSAENGNIAVTETEISCCEHIRGEHDGLMIKAFDYKNGDYIKIIITAETVFIINIPEAKE